MKTIRKRIVAIAAICALIMGLSLGGLSYYYSGHMATEDSETLMLAKSDKGKIGQHLIGNTAIGSDIDRNRCK